MSAQSIHLMQCPSSARPARRSATVAGQQRRVYFVRRLGVLALLAVLAVLVSMVISTRFADADSSGSRAVLADLSESANVVVVQPGDTFWKLARSVQPTGDVRPLIAQLSRAHGGSALRAGERIVLPAANS